MHLSTHVSPQRLQFYYLVTYLSRTWRSAGFRSGLTLREAFGMNLFLVPVLLLSLPVRFGRPAPNQELWQWSDRIGFGALTAICGDEIWIRVLNSDLFAARLNVLNLLHPLKSDACNRIQASTAPTCFGSWCATSEEWPRHFGHLLLSGTSGDKVPAAWLTGHRAQGCKLQRAVIVAISEFHLQVVALCDVV